MYKAKIGVVCVVYITTVKQLQLLEDSLLSLRSFHDLEFLGVINRVDADFEERINALFPNRIVNDENCLAKAWNIGAKRFSDKDFIIFPNMDIKSQEHTINNLIIFAGQHKDDYMFSAYALGSIGNKVPNAEGFYNVSHVTMWDNYSFFMTRPKVFEKIGYFDENIKPAYCEDLDFQYRLELAGLRSMCVYNAKYEHYGNATIKDHVDPEYAKTNLTQSNSEKYVIEKWGGIREGMIYTTPFNKAL